MNARVRTIGVLAVGAVIGAATTLLLDPGAGRGAQAGQPRLGSLQPATHADVKLPIHIRNCGPDCSERHHVGDIGNNSISGYHGTNILSNMSVNGGGSEAPATKVLIPATARKKPKTRSGIVITLPEEFMPGGTPDRQQSIYIFGAPNDPKNPDNVIIMTCPYVSPSPGDSVTPCPIK